MTWDQIVEGDSESIDKASMGNFVSFYADFQTENWTSVSIGTKLKVPDEGIDYKVKFKDFCKTKMNGALLKEQILP